MHPLPGCGRLLVSAVDLASIATASPLGAYLVRHSLRWLALSPFRLRALRFPLWDLAPALDFLGLLPARVDTQCVRLQGRGLFATRRERAPDRVPFTPWTSPPPWLTSVSCSPIHAASSRTIEGRSHS